MAEGCAVNCVTAWPISRHPLINSSLAFTAAQPHSSAASLASISSGVKKLRALLKCFGLHINDQRKQPPMTAKHAGLAQIMSDIIVNLKKSWNIYAPIVWKNASEKHWCLGVAPSALFRGTKDHFAWILHINLRTTERRAAGVGRHALLHTEEDAHTVYTRAHSPRLQFKHTRCWWKSHAHYICVAASLFLFQTLRHSWLMNRERRVHLSENSTWQNVVGMCNTAYL